MKKKKHSKNLEEELQREFGQWDTLYTFGGHDPFWSDGCNLNLVRNHILYYKKEIEKVGDPQHYPSIYYKETPPEVSQDYMARSEEIRENAKKSLEVYKKDENYRFLLSRVDWLNSKDAKEISIRNVINYVKGLEQAIVSKDLISMRRHENPEHYVTSFRECAERIKSIKPKEMGQLSLFDLYSEGLQEDGEEEDQGMNMSL